MRSGIIALTALALLTACADQAVSNVPPPLPDVVAYSRDIELKAAAEIEGGSCPVLGDVFMPDYLVMRWQTRCAADMLVSGQEDACTRPNILSSKR